jgi:CubicO group peptidase (beta-lactamase class C family)
MQSPATGQAATFTPAGTVESEAQPGSMPNTNLAIKVQQALDELVGSGAEVGLQVAGMQHGDLLVDAVSGLADPDSGTPVTTETLFWAASTAKGVTSSIAHVLAEQGRVDYDMHVVEVWPEFARHGKEAITVRQILLHTAGLPGLPPDITVEELCDWDHMCAVLAAAEPWWRPGSKFGYHANTFGFLIGETLHRATGRTIQTLLEETITSPLDLEQDIYLGVPPERRGSVARQIDGSAGSPAEPPPGSAAARAEPPGIRHNAEYVNRADVLAAVIPSEGTMTARGVARMYAALLGQVPGVHLVSTERLVAMAAIHFTGIDDVMAVPTSWAFGYSPFRPSGACRPGSSFGMVGMNGSGAYADIDSGVVVALMRNRFAPGDFSTLARIDQIVVDSLS